MFFKKNLDTKTNKSTNEYKGGITLAQIIVFTLILYYLFSGYSTDKEKQRKLEEKVMVKQEISTEPLPEIKSETPLTEAPKNLNQLEVLAGILESAAHCGDSVYTKVFSKGLNFSEKNFSILLGEKDLYEKNFQSAFLGAKKTDNIELSLNKIFTEDSYLNEANLYDFLQNEITKSLSSTVINFYVDEVDRIYEKDSTALKIIIEELENISLKPASKFCGDTTVIGFKLISNNIEVKKVQPPLKQKEGFDFVRVKIGDYSVPLVIERLSVYIVDGSRVLMLVPFEELKTIGKNNQLSFVQKKPIDNEIIKLEIVGENYFELKQNTDLD